MTEQEAYALVGLLLLHGDYYNEGPDEEGFPNNYCTTIMVFEYLKALKLDYEYVKDIILMEYYNFYHNDWGFEDTPLPENYDKEKLMCSEYDYIEISEAGRIGIWCEVDGFIAWLDECGITWVTDTKEEIEARRKKTDEWFDKEIKPIVNNAFGSGNEPPELPHTLDEYKNWYKDSADRLLEYYKVHPVTLEGLPTYTRKDTNVYWENHKPIVRKVHNGKSKKKRKAKKQ